jgi:multicomponent Na+:H+ antiporter subunit G
VIWEWIGNGLATAGVIFSLIGSIGVLRLPEFYARAHAASKPDTLGLILVMVGLAIRHGVDVSSAKMLLIVFFVALANPAATHALGRSAMRSGLQPFTRDAKEPS